MRDPANFWFMQPTEWLDRMSHRKWRATKHHPSRVTSSHQISCCLVSLRFLCDILSSHSVGEAFLRYCRESNLAKFGYQMVPPVPFFCVLILLYLNWLAFTSITLGIRLPTTYVAAPTFLWGPLHSTAISLSLPFLLWYPNIIMTKVARTRFSKILLRLGSNQVDNTQPLTKYIWTSHYIDVALRSNILPSSPELPSASATFAIQWRNEPSPIGNEVDRSSL